MTERKQGSPTPRQEDPRFRYELLDKIGKGGYAYVYRAWDSVDERYVAVKIINLEDAGDDVEDVHREIEVMSNIDCEQLTKYHTSFVVKENLWIVMEHLEAGSLLDIIKECGPLEERFVAYIMKELLMALRYLHDERKIHRDVKAGNLLAGGDGSVKLADFGVTGQLTDSMNKRQTKIGTPFWMAPEVISQSSYDGCADIWSTGITAIELSKGTPPYANKIHPFQAILLIPKNPPPVLEGEEFSAEFKDFVACCLVKAPSDRPSAAELLAHPFVANAEKLPEWEAFIHNAIEERHRKVLSKSQDAADMSGAESGEDTGEWNFTQRTQTQGTHTPAAHSHQNSAVFSNNSFRRSLSRSISASISRSNSNSNISNILSRNSSYANNYNSHNSSGLAIGYNSRSGGAAGSGGAEDLRTDSRADSSSPLGLGGSRGGGGQGGGDSPITLESLEYYSSDEERRTATPPKHRPDGTPRHQRIDGGFFQSGSAYNSSSNTPRDRGDSRSDRSGKGVNGAGGRKETEYEKNFPTAFPPSKANSNDHTAAAVADGTHQLVRASSWSQGKAKKLSQQQRYQHQSGQAAASTGMSGSSDAAGAISAPSTASSAASRRLGYELTPPRSPPRRNHRHSLHNPIGAATAVVRSSQGGMVSPRGSSSTSTTPRPLSTSSPNTGLGGYGKGGFPPRGIGRTPSPAGYDFKDGADSSSHAGSSLHCASNDTAVSNSTLKHAMETIQDMQKREAALCKQIQDLRDENMRLKVAAEPYFSVLNILLRHRDNLTSAAASATTATAASNVPTGAGGTALSAASPATSTVVVKETASPSEDPDTPMLHLPHHVSHNQQRRANAGTGQFVPPLPLAVTFNANSNNAATTGGGNDGVAAAAALSPIATGGSDHSNSSNNSDKGNTTTAASTSSSATTVAASDVAGFISRPSASLLRRIRVDKFDNNNNTTATSTDTTTGFGVDRVSSIESDGPAGTKSSDGGILQIPIACSTSDSDMPTAVNRSRSDSSNNSSSITPRAMTVSATSNSSSNSNSNTNTKGKMKSKSNGVDAVLGLLQTLENYQHGSELFYQVTQPALHQLQQKINDCVGNATASTATAFAASTSATAAAATMENKSTGNTPTNAAGAADNKTINTVASLGLFDATTGQSIVRLLRTILGALDALPAPPELQLLTPITVGEGIEGDESDLDGMDDYDATVTTPPPAAAAAGTTDHINSSNSSSNSNDNTNSRKNRKVAEAVKSVSERCGGWSLELLSMLTAYMEDELELPDRL